MAVATPAQQHATAQESLATLIRSQGFHLETSDEGQFFFGVASISVAPNGTEELYLEAERGR